MSSVNVNVHALPFLLYLLHILDFYFVPILQHKTSKVHNNISTKLDNKEPVPKGQVPLSNTTHPIFTNYLVVLKSIHLQFQQFHPAFQNVNNARHPAVLLYSCQAQ